MALYEMRTYTLYVGKMAEATKLYQELGFPALKKGGHDKKLIGYFQGDTGTINQLMHLWKFDDDADRRKHWAGVFANKDFVEGFASKFRPLVMSQEVKLLTAAPFRRAEYIASRTRGTMCTRQRSCPFGARSRDSSSGLRAIRALRRVPTPWSITAWKAPYFLRRLRDLMHGTLPTGLSHGGGLLCLNGWSRVAPAFLSMKPA